MSKAYLYDGDASRLMFRQPAYYPEKQIELISGVHVQALDVNKRVVQLDDGSQLDFDQLVLATDARNRELAIAGGEYANVAQLRTLRHAEPKALLAEGVGRMPVYHGLDD